MDNVVRVGVFLTDMKHFTEMNGAYEKFYEGKEKPVRPLSFFPLISPSPPPRPRFMLSVQGGGEDISPKDTPPNP